jgi:large subunit ribosomal protein L24
MKIQKDDMVVVVAGDHKSNAPHTPHRVVQIVEGGKRIVVEGINRVFKHVRRGHPKSPQGGRLQMEMPIATSNVMFYCGGCSKPVRIGYRYTDDGAKERYCRSCNTTVSAISPPRSQYAKK